LPQFPSSEVVITTSTDLSARIFSALDGSNPRTLQGHTAAVTDCAIIERGRHVLTTSNDGTMKLWLVGEAKCLKTWRFGRETRKRALKVAVIAEARPSAGLDSELSGKAAVIALDDGSLTLVNLEASGADPPLQTVEVSRTKKALSAVSVHRVGNSLRIATGSVDGIVSLLQLDATDLAKPAKIIVQYKRNGADITSLSFARAEQEQADVLSLLVATMDGLLFESAITTRQEDPEIKVQMEYAGYDIDACNAVVQRGSDIYSAGKDGHLRRY
jgi:proteasomal ATPase-associated factor 1